MDIKNVINSKVQKSRQYYKHITFGCVFCLSFLRKVASAISSTTLNGMHNMHKYIN